MSTFEGRLISTWPVLTEVCYMLDFNPETQMDFLDWVIHGGIDVHNLEPWQLNSIRETLKIYSDLPADFADASLLETAESKNLTSILTLDKDFSVYKLKNGHFLKNLLD
ncbi:PIN domain-containing protein [soil metagenome]